MATVKFTVRDAGRGWAYNVHHLLVAFPEGQAAPEVRAVEGQVTRRDRWDESIKVMTLDFPEGVFLYVMADEYGDGPDQHNVIRPLQEYADVVLDDEDSADRHFIELAIYDAVELLCELLPRRKAKAMDRAVLGFMQNEVRMSILRSVARRLGVSDQVEIPQQGSAKWVAYAIARAMGWSPPVLEPKPVDGVVVMSGYDFVSFPINDLTQDLSWEVEVIDDLKKTSYSFRTGKANKADSPNGN